MEEIVEPTSPAQTRANSRIHSRANSRAHSRTQTGNASFANFAIASERQPLLTQVTASLENALGPIDRNRPVAGGTVLGIHNLAIVFPQFLVCRFPSLDSFLLGVIFLTCFSGFPRRRYYLQRGRWKSTR